MPSDLFTTPRRRAALCLLAGALAAILAAPALSAPDLSDPDLPAPTQSEGAKRIGVIGAGHIGGTLGPLWIKAGYDVMFASRHPEELRPLAESLGPKAHVGTPAEALAFGEAVLIAVPYKAYPELGRGLGEALKGRIVLDAGNAVKARDGELYDEVQADGIGAVSKKYLPGARIVRAFNAANFKVFEKNAGRPAPRMAVPIAGDDQGAVESAKTLVSDAGFDPVVVGPLEDARRFQMGTPGFGHDLPAPELRAKLGVAP